MAASDDPAEELPADDELDEDLEDLEDLDDEDFDPESAEDELEPGLDDELVDAEELSVEDAAIEMSLSAVEEAEQPDDEEEADEIAIADVDDLDDEDALVRVVEDDDIAVDEGLREGEFICSSCYLAKGPSQLADAERQICVDCV